MQKELLVAPTPIRVSPQDQRRNPLERTSSLSQPRFSVHQHDQRGTIPSGTSSQKRKSTDYHQGEVGKPKQWVVDRSKAEGTGGGGLPDEGPSPVLRSWCSPLSVLLVNFLISVWIYLYTHQNPS